MALPFSIPAPKSARQVTLKLRFKTGTPILGGGVLARELCQDAPIRVPSLRGQFRFWWRAITDDAADAEALYRRETELWGGVNSKQKNEAVTKSEVRVVVTDVKNAGEDTSEIVLSNRDAYALWPARGTAKGEEAASRWNPGLSFGLEIIFPAEREAEIRQMLSAWICFGGYGSRTRRGVGKLIPDCLESRAHVPIAGTRDGLEALFPSLFNQVPQINDWPRLRGVYLAIGRPNQDCLKTWYTALDWLREFRQGEPSSGTLGTHDMNRARVLGGQAVYQKNGETRKAHRPSISNWPEADKVRRLTPGNWSHQPNHNATPVWPKAALGLPVVSKFQTDDRNGGSLKEPGNYELRWQDSQGNIHDRLGSPLFMGAMPIQANNGDSAYQFVSYALWLSRAYPGGQVVAVRNEEIIRNSGAPFDELVAAEDQARFQPLATGQLAQQGTRMRTAFFAWLKQRHPNLTYLP